MNLSTQAYLKPLLHSIKHPASAIVGLLLCPQNSNEIVDVIPLHHHWVTLSPMTEAGLGIVCPPSLLPLNALRDGQANEYASTSKLNIGGIYLANSKVDDVTISATGEVLARQIARQLGRESLILVIDSKLLPTGKSPYQAYTVSPASAPASTSVIPPADLDTVTYLRNSKLVQSIGDFDEHLENIGVGFLGQEIEPLQ